MRPPTSKEDVSTPPESSHAIRRTNAHVAVVVRSGTEGLTTSAAEPTEHTAQTTEPPLDLNLPGVSSSSSSKLKTPVIMTTGYLEGTLSPGPPLCAKPHKDSIKILSKSPSCYSKSPLVTMRIGESLPTTSNVPIQYGANVELSLLFEAKFQRF